MVYVKNHGDSDNLIGMLREFNRKVKNAGIIKECYTRREYMKPSEKRKWKQEESLRKRIRESQKEQKSKSKF
ncbi:MAG: 30S ribosomal protein S21 [Betaproteobacteria bacterium]|jgi:ribosomal protein S21